MKKILFALALGFVFSAVPAYAAPAGCDIPPDHAIYDEAGTMVVGCIKAQVWAAAQAEAQSSNIGLPIVRRGTTVTDDHGITDRCDAWYAMDCVNIYQTAAYRNAMTATVRELVSKGYSAAQFPVLKGWFDSIR